MKIILLILLVFLQMLFGQTKELTIQKFEYEKSYLIKNLSMKKII